MKVFVAGGSGFVGRHVCEELHAAGHTVRKGHWSTLPDFEDKRFENYYGDLRGTSGATWGCRGVDAVVMCAAVTSGAKDIVQDPLLHVVDNTVMNTRMMHAAYEEGVQKFVFVSSSTVYPPRDFPTCEALSFVGDPEPVYQWVGHMKRYAEMQGWMYANRIDPRMNFTAIRPANVYGPGDKFDPDKSHMTASMIRKFAERADPLAVWGDGRDRRDLLYVTDLARAIRLAVEKEEPYESYNIATGSAWSVRDVIFLLSEITEHEPQVLYGQGPQTARYRALTTGHAKKRLGFEAAVTLDEGLRRTLTWYETNGGEK